MKHEIPVEFSPWPRDLHARESVYDDRMDGGSDEDVDFFPPRSPYDFAWLVVLTFLPWLFISSVVMAVWKWDAICAYVALLWRRLGV
jgi:hypothetical protein